MSKRESGLDLLRCMALLFVVTFHSFLNNGYYGEPQVGVGMWLAGSVRWLSVACIGLFLMLTGYLKSEKTSVRDCWRGLGRVLIGYLLAAVVSIPVRHVLLGEVQPWTVWLGRLFGFGAVYYGWYVEMYVGLILLSPFVNRLLKQLHTPRQLLTLVGVMLVLTALPGATTLPIAPDHWRGIYPLTYYLLGAAVKRLQPRIRPWIGIAGALMLSLVLGGVTVLSTDGDFSGAWVQEFPDFWITVIVVCLFVALYRVKLSPVLGRLFAFGAGGCYGGYLLSHLFDAWCYRLLPAWRTPAGYPWLFLCVTVPIFAVSVLGGNLLERLADRLPAWGRGEAPARRYRAADGVRQLLLAWMAAVCVEYLLLPAPLRTLEHLEGLAQMSLSRMLTVTLVGAILLLAASTAWRTVVWERWGLVGVFGVLSVAVLTANRSAAFLGVCLLIAGALVVYALRGWDKSPAPAVKARGEHRSCLWITVGLSVVFFLFVSVWTVARVLSFHTPTYDFGIFAQMFHSMKESGLPMTTLERDGLLSHFRVHVSPIYYLMLPFYLLVPTPATLQVLQAAVLASAVIPLWKLGRHHGLSDGQRMLLCAVLLLYPAFSGGASYDIHENCFLTPLILWLFYGIDRKKPITVAVFALLTLCVKEDAAVYVAVIALWLIVKALVRFRRRALGDLAMGMALLGVSLIWFACVTRYLATVGDGVMTGRYRNFMYDGSSSLITVVRAVLLHPMKALYECVDAEKLSFIGMTLVPLLGLPLLTRRYERYLLLIPYLLVNLMSDYVYQHDIFFQYTFGSTACLMYLTVVNLADMKISRRRLAALAAAAAVCAGCFGTTVAPKAVYYPIEYIRQREHYQSIRETLAQIPDGASVTATTFYTTFLSEREVVYDFGYASREHLLSSEYIVLSLSATGEFRKYAAGGKENGYARLVQMLAQNGYEQYAELSGVLVIFRKGGGGS